MATRPSPFKGETAYALSAAISQPAQPLSAPVPSPLPRMIERCLEKNRAHRYHTAGEVAAGLELSESSFSSTSSPSVHGKWAAAIGGLVLAALLALVAVTRRERVPHHPPRAYTVLRFFLSSHRRHGEESHLGVGIADAHHPSCRGARLVLRPTTAVFPYAGKSPDPPPWAPPSPSTRSSSELSSRRNHLSCKPPDGPCGRRQLDRMGSNTRCVP